MFKIKSQVEITREDESFIRKNGYDPKAGSYICPNCKAIKYVSDFFNYNDTEKAINSLLKSKDYKIDEFESMQGFSFIRTYHCNCLSCDFPNDADIVFFIKKQTQNWEIDAEIVGSKTLEFFFNSFLSLGIDIYSILPSLILRWWRNKYKIDIVVPFINREYFELFQNTGKFMVSYNKKYSDQKIDLEKNPFRYIVFRKFQSRYKGIERKVSDEINDYYKNIFEKNGDDYFYISTDVIAFISASIYQVVNKVKSETLDDLGQKYSGNFHAKFLSGFDERNAELYLMSYNFGDIEALQFETHFLTVLDSIKYQMEMDVFMNYHRLQIEKYK
jgi:hypothetical protein